MQFESATVTIQVEADCVTLTSGFTRLVMNLRQGREFHAVLGEALDYMDGLRREPKASDVGTGEC